jgi:ATP synthase protein I
MDGKPTHRRRGLLGGRNEAYRVIWAQLAVALLLAAGYWLLIDVSAGMAALAGGLINVVANLAFALRFIGVGRVKSSGEMVMAFFVGEFVKLALTVGLLVVAIAVLKFDFVPLFVTFVATLSVTWFALLPQFSRIFGDRP